MKRQVTFDRESKQSRQRVTLRMQERQRRVNAGVEGRGRYARQIRVIRAFRNRGSRTRNLYAGAILTLGRRNRLTWSQMKSKTDDIQEREDDACGMTLFFDNHVDIGSKNSAKRGQSHSWERHRLAHSARQGWGEREREGKRGRREKDQRGILFWGRNNETSVASFFPSLSNSFFF